MSKLRRTSAEVKLVKSSHTTTLILPAVNFCNTSMFGRPMPNLGFGLWIDQEVMGQREARGARRDEKVSWTIWTRSKPFFLKYLGGSSGWA